MNLQVLISRYPFYHKLSIARCNFFISFISKSIRVPAVHLKKKMYSNDCTRRSDDDGGSVPIRYNLEKKARGSGCAKGPAVPLKQPQVLPEKKKC